MSGKTSETRCKRDEQIYPATTECISGQHEDCSGRGPLITNLKEIVDCKCKCHEPTPPEGEADPLSPLLDMRVVEGLSEELRKAKAEGEAVRPSTFAEMEIKGTVGLDSGHGGTRRACNNEDCSKDYQHSGPCDPVVSTAAPELRAEYDFSDGIRGKYFLRQLWLAFKPFLDTVDEGDGFPDDKEINFTVQWKRVKYAFGLWSRLPGSNRTPVAPESYKPAEGPDFCECPNPYEGARPLLTPRFCERCKKPLKLPAATPVTVEAPEPQIQEAKKHFEQWWIKGNPHSDTARYAAVLLNALRAPKPIGDVEAVAEQIFNECDDLRQMKRGYHAALPIFSEHIKAILSPLLRPRPGKGEKVNGILSALPHLYK